MTQLTTAMDSTPEYRPSPIRRTVHSAQILWHDAEPRTRTAVQVGALLGVVVIAYSYSLTTLWQLAGLNTPLAYVGLVPIISLALAAAHGRPVEREPAIHDRQTDYIVGIPLMAAALFINFFLPSRLSAMFWVWRIDLLTLPFFVAGAVTVIFGVRVLWRQKVAVGFLFLAWPYPYTTVLLGLLNAFTSATLFGMDRILRVFHVAAPLAGAGTDVFSLSYHGHPFTLSVVSACSGVSSVVGFLLVGTAFAAVIRGPLLRKMLWLLGGMILLWTINLGRITLIFWAGHEFGEHLAIDVLHPFIGLVTFTAGVGIMILCIHPMGLVIGSKDRIEPHDGPGVTSEDHAHAIRAHGPIAVPKVYLAVVVVLVLGIVIGITNVQLQTYNLVANVAGQSKLTSFIDGPVTPSGWISKYQATFHWATPLFGEDSTWNRYELYPQSGGDLHASTSLIADVIDTPDLQAFSAFGIEQCYQFHGYALTDLSQMSLGGGITGQSLAYTSDQFGSWTIVYWIVPVIQGDAKVYERIVLYVQNVRGVIAPATEGDQAGIRNLAGSLDANNPKELVLLQNRDFLVAYARELIRDQAIRSARLLGHSTAA
jgi:exosortase/archaeosortase family protein